MELSNNTEYLRTVRQLRENTHQGSNLEQSRRSSKHTDWGFSEDFPYYIHVFSAPFIPAFALPVLFFNRGKIVHASKVSK